jgi:hypothetical protein
MYFFLSKKVRGFTRAGRVLTFLATRVLAQFLLESMVKETVFLPPPPDGGL